MCEDLGDFIIARSDGTAAFMFANAIDDALMGVTHALRGEDHLTNTPRQLLILKALGLTAPLYGHMNLIVGPDGAPLSKRHGSKSLRALAEQGYLPLALINYLARLGHRYDQEHLMDMEHLARHFQLDHCGVAPARFDSSQLLYWQKQALFQLDQEAFARWADTVDLSLVPKDKKADFLALVKPNVHFREDLQQWSERLFHQDRNWSEEAQSVMKEAGLDSLQTMQSAFAASGTYSEALAHIKAHTTLKAKALFMPLRMILTDCHHGPELPDVVTLLGMRRAHQRFQEAYHWLNQVTKQEK